MTSMSLPVQVRLTRRDGTGQLDLTPGSTWDFNQLRSRVPQANVDVSNCEGVDRYIPFCDWLEFIIGPSLAMRFLYRGTKPSGAQTTIRGVGALIQFSRRRHETARTLVGQAVPIWRDLFNVAEATEPLGVNLGVGTDYGQTVEINATANQSINDSLNELAGVYVTYTEHSGAVELRAIGDEPEGPSIGRHWLTPDSAGRAPEMDADSYVNEVVIQYGPNLDQVATWPPNFAPDAGRPGCRLLGPPVRFQEIAATDSASAFDTAKRVYDVLSQPQILLSDIQLEPSKVDWDWLVAGRKQFSNLEGSERRQFSLDSVEVSGRGNAATSIIANWDQADVAALQSRIQQVAA